MASSKVDGLIQKINPGDGTNYSIASTAYGYCETSASDSNKIVEIEGFQLLEGTTIHIKFKYQNTAINPTLKVNSNGEAKPIKRFRRDEDTNTSEIFWAGDSILSFTYDGSAWVINQSFTNDPLRKDSTFSDDVLEYVNKGILYSPTSKYLWHDLLAFDRLGFIYRTSEDNTTWTEVTDAITLASIKDLFNQKGLNSVSIFSSSSQISGVQFIWNAGAISWSIGRWLVIGINHTVSTAIYTIKLESSSNGSSWTTRHLSTDNQEALVKFLFVNDYASDSYLRLTITKEPGSTGSLNLNSIKLLSSRLGNQGGGPEYEYPYDWDNNKTLITKFIRPDSDNTKDLGTSSYKWNNLYINTIRFGGSSYSPNNYITSNGSENIFFNINGDTSLIVEKNDIRPGTGKTVDLGTSSIKWNNVYANNFKGNADSATAVTQNASNLNNTNYRILLSGTATDNTETTSLNKASGLIYNPSTYKLTVGNIDVNGNLNVIGSVVLNGETIIESETVGDMLVNGGATFVQSPVAPTPSSNDNSTKVATTEFVKNSVAGLSGAMHFIGTTTTSLTDGATTNPISISGSSYTAVAGDVVLWDDSEFVWIGTRWERLGRDTSFKVQQSAVPNPSASGSTTAFIDSISQDANGVITVTKKNLDTSGLVLPSELNNYLLLTGGTMINTSTNNAQINFPTYNGADTSLSIYGGTADQKAGITFSAYSGKRNIIINGNTIVIDNLTETSGWVGYLGVKKDASNNYVGLGWYGEGSVLKYFYMGGAYNSPYLRMYNDTDSTNGYFSFSRNIQPYSGASVSLGTTTYKWSDLYVKDFFTKEATESGTTYRTLMIGNETNRTGRISLYSGSKGGYIQQAATNNWVLHQLPVESGWIVKAGNGTSTGTGDKETPIYVDTRGVAKPVNALPVNQNLLMNTQYYFNNSYGTKPIKTISAQDIPMADCHSKYGVASGVGVTDLSLGTFAPEPDTWYTLSFYARTNYNNTSIRTHFYPDTTATSYNCQGYSSTGGDGISIFTASTKWQRYWVCYKTSASVSGTKNLIARLISGISPGTTLRVALPKLEVGQVMTPWVPHAQDFSQNKISTCYVDNHDLNNYQWHRIATCSVGTTNYSDRDIILFVHKGYLANAFGILKISVRTDSNEAPPIKVQAKWLLRHGFSESDCFIGLTRTSIDASSAATADIYFKTSTTCARIIFTALNNFNKGFTLLNSDENSKTENDVKVTDLANSTEVYIKEDNMNGDTIESIKLKGDASSNTGTTYVSWAYASDSSSEKSLIPNANVAYDLGTSSQKWANVYANNYYGNWVGETIPVNKGGTGQTSFTTNYVLVGNGTNGIKASSKLQIPVNDTGMITAILPMNLSGGGTNISATDNSTGNLIIGSRTADHLALDTNEIQGRNYSNGTCTANPICLNYRGGEVWLGLNGAIRTGNVALYPKDDLSLTLGKNAARWSNIYTKGNINIGLAGDEATIQYDSTNKTLNFIFN